MSVNQVYHTWFHRIRQMRPGERVTRVRNMAWLIVGILASHSVHLSRVASKIPGQAVLNSNVQRIRRFLSNPAVCVRQWYEPVAKRLLESQAQGGGGIRLLLDGSKVGFGHQLLMVAMGYRRRADPPVAYSAGADRRGPAGRIVAVAAAVGCIVVEAVAAVGCIAGQGDLRRHLLLHHRHHHRLRDHLITESGRPQP